MLKIKLTRTGAKNWPSYRIVVAEAKSKRDGRVVESLGFYDPKTKPAGLKIKRDRLRYWLEKGAQPTSAVRQLYENDGKTA